MKVVAALNTQLDYLMFFEGKSKNNFLKDAYFQRYAFGMFDAITTMFGLELRRKLGVKLIALNYVKYLMLEFELKQADALDMFRKVRDFYNTENGQRDRAVLDGGFDGVSVLQGEANSPQKLTKHFSADTDYDAPMPRAEAAKYLEQLPRFQEFCGPRWLVDKAIREAEMTAKAMMNNEIAI